MFARVGSPSWPSDSKMTSNCSSGVRLPTVHSLHGHRCVAFNRDQLAQRRVTLCQVLDPRALEIEVLILQRVRVLVRHDDLVAGPEGCIALDDVEALGVGTVVRRQPARRTGRAAAASMSASSGSSPARLRAALQRVATPREFRRS